MVTIAFGLNHRHVPLDVLEAVSVSPEGKAKLARQLAASVALIAATGGGWHAEATEAATTAAVATTSGT